MKPLQLLIAFIVFCHGFVYVWIGSALPEPIQGWNGRSWLVGDLVNTHQVTTLAIALHVLAGTALLGCAAAIGIESTLSGWWRPLAIAGGGLGITAFAVFWDGQTRLLLQEGAIGAVISLALLSAALIQW